jgi:hypothetical protein
LGEQSGHTATPLDIERRGWFDKVPGRHANPSQSTQNETNYIILGRFIRVEDRDQLSNSIENFELRRYDMTALLSNSFSHRWQIEQLRHITLFKATDMDIASLLQEDLPSIPQDHIDEPVCLLGVVQSHGHPYLFNKLLSTKLLRQLIRKPRKNFESFSQD